MQEGKLGKGLKELLNKVIVEKGKNKEELVVVDPKLGIKVISDIDTLELLCGIRCQLTALLNELNPKDLATMSLGLSHSLSRFKLKFSLDKVDTMVVQAITLLDDLDKEINIYVIRVKEWYGRHFSEMSKVLSENLAYAKVVKLLALAGFRTNAATTDFAAILPEELEATIKSPPKYLWVQKYRNPTSPTSTRSAIRLSRSQSTVRNFQSICAMITIAPNLTALVGELVGARLISHAGSLLNRAKHPTSTVQILGAEKALFRALKTKHETPKYGLIYHASLVGQAPPKLKGKTARMVATKTAISVRVDALTDTDEKSTPSAPIIGFENRAKLEACLRSLEAECDATGVRRFAMGPNQQKRIKLGPAASTHNPATDAVGLVSTQREPIEEAVKAVLDVKEEKRCAKRRAEKEKAAAAQEEKPDAAAVDGEADAMEVDGEEKEGVQTEAERKARKLAKKAEKAAVS
ncbi:hypothetical protein F5888DRAFT_1809844 [Russula emetica]|nr:hypothetical protein F5888DRAFT_1809844 [Russula emetica]